MNAAVCMYILVYFSSYECSIRNFISFLHTFFLMFYPRVFALPPQFLYCIVYISLFQFSWVQYKEFQFISTYNFFGYNQFELRVPFRLTNEGFDTWHPLWIYSQCPQAFMSKSTFFHFELSSGALSFTFYEYVFRFLILIFNLIIYLMS